MLFTLALSPRRVANEVLQGRIPYSVPPPASAPLPEFPEDSGSDWNACEEDFESEADEAE